MSKYTMEVRFACESALGMTESKGYNDVEDIVERAAPLIFNNFPIFDETYRLPLEKKILMHYYTREIGEETVGLWKLRLASKMNEIMPYFNKLYETELLRYEPFYDVDLTTQREASGQVIGSNRGVTDSESLSANNRVSMEKNEKETNSSSNETNLDKNIKKDTSNTVENNVETGNVNGNVHEYGDGSATKDVTDNQTHWDLYSDTPQGTIENIAAGSSDHNRYLTNARENTDNDIYDEDTTYEDDKTTITNDKTKTEGTRVIANDGDSEQRNERIVGRTGALVDNGITTGNVAESRDETGKITTENLNNVNSLDSYTERVFGKRGGMTYTKMLMELRDSFINIDEMVINKLSDLFFGLW